MCIVNLGVNNEQKHWRYANLKINIDYVKAGSGYYCESQYVRIRNLNCGRTDPDKLDLYCHVSSLDVVDDPLVRIQNSGGKL